MLRDRPGESAHFERAPRVSPLPRYIPRAARCAECGGEFVKVQPNTNTCGDACRGARDARIKARAVKRQREARGKARA
jgi:hypothetical protein